MRTIFPVSPHIAVIDNGSNRYDDLSIPLNQTTQLSYPFLSTAQREWQSCGIFYDGGLLYCAPNTGICSFHKLGSAVWTQPPQLQPGFVSPRAGCAVFANQMWITGGCLGQSKSK